MSVSNMRKNDHHNIPVLGPNGTIVENWSSISPKIAKVNYVWIINYYSFYHKNGEQLRSPIFTATANNRCMWFLQLCFGNDEFIGIDIILDRASECNKVFAKFTVSILDNERKQLVTKYSQTCEFDGIRGDYWGFKKFVCKSHLSDLDKFAPDDKLTIYCEITFSELEDLVENSDQIDSAWFQPKVPVNDLSEDLKRFYTSQHLTDVVISVKGKCFPAHKVILAARSSVFSAMFTHDTKENQSNRVDITDIDENIVEEMLYYMYTGNIHDLDNSAEGLLMVADKYEMEGLKAKSEDALLKKLTVQNAVDNLVLADFHHADKLKLKTISFIVAKSVEVMRTKSWNDIVLSHPHLVNEVCRALSHQLALYS